MDADVGRHQCAAALVQVGEPPAQRLGLIAALGCRQGAGGELDHVGVVGVGGGHACATEAKSRHLIFAISRSPARVINSVFGRATMPSAWKFPHVD